jgi:TonB family protein
MKPKRRAISISLALTLASAVAALAQQGSGARSAGPKVDRCDRPAASPHDTTRPGGVPGVAFDQVDGSGAIEACRAALARPGDARLTYQFAQALDRNRGYYAPAEGIYNLGRSYEDGRDGWPKDDGEAARLYRRAADLGSKAAQRRLGFFYETGRGGLQQDIDEAVRLYRAAVGGDAAPGSATHEEKYQYYLSIKIRTNVTYPPEAKRANLQGAAVVSFAILSNGEIGPETLKVTKSSGYPRLDVAALQAVSVSAPFAPPPNEMTASITINYVAN